jgi:hypothetical protein
LSHFVGREVSYFETDEFSFLVKWVPRQTDAGLGFPRLAPHPRHAHVRAFFVLELILESHATPRLPTRGLGQNELELVGHVVGNPWHPLEARRARITHQRRHERCFSIRIGPRPVEHLVCPELVERPGHRLPVGLHHGRPIAHAIKDLDRQPAFEVRSQKSLLLGAIAFANAVLQKPELGMRGSLARALEVERTRLPVLAQGKHGEGWQKVIAPARHSQLDKLFHGKRKSSRQSVNVQQTPLGLLREHVLKLILLPQEMKLGGEVFLRECEEHEVCVEPVDERRLLRVLAEPCKELVLALARLVGCRELPGRELSAHGGCKRFHPGRLRRQLMPVKLLSFGLAHATLSLLNLLGVRRQPIQSQIHPVSADERLEVMERAENRGNAVGLVEVTVQEAVEVDEESGRPVGRTQGLDDAPVRTHQ